jgi:hypothetical protein
VPLLLLLDELEPVVAGEAEDEEEEDDDDEDDDDDMEDWPLSSSIIIGFPTVPLPLVLDGGGGPKTSLISMRSINSLTSADPK